MLAHELVNQSVDKTTVDSVLSGIHGAEETEAALQLAQKQVQRYRSLPRAVGFDYETIQSVIERVLVKGNAQ